MRSGPAIAQRRDWLRLLGGLLLAAGAIALLTRKSSQWGAGAEFLTLLVPCAVCLVLALVGLRGRGPGRAFEPWRSTLLVIGVVLLPFTLDALVEWLGGNSGDELNVFWIFGLTAALAAFASLRLGAVYQLLLAGLAGIVAWLALWTKILDHPQANTIRWLLLILAAIYLGLAVFLRRRDLAARGRDAVGGEGDASGVAGDAHREGSGDVARAEARRHGDLVTAAGIAAIGAGMITLLLLLGRVPAIASRLSVGQTAQPNEFWNILLLVESLALIAYGSWAGLRGPGYVGAFGLLAFVVIVGVNLRALVDGTDPHKVFAWPVILLVLGAVLLVGSYALGTLRQRAREPVGAGTSGDPGPSSGELGPPRL